MLINFSFENWRSFYESNSFTMIATSERQQGERVPRINKYRTRVLPIAALYGGNASGKTNFCQAMRFVKKMVVQGTGSEPDRYIDVEPFRLDKKAKDKPSRFKIEVLVDEMIYELSFAVTRKRVSEEKLTQITSSSEKVLYDRNGENIDFHPSLEKDEFLKYAYKGTRDNQLFLTNTVSQNIDIFKPIHNWFKNDLVMIAPDTRFGAYNYFIDEENPLYATMNELLPLLDTGIEHLSGEEMAIDNAAIPKLIKEKLQEEVEEDKPALVMSPQEHKWYTVKRENGELIAKKLVTYHENSEGEEVKFEIVDESDGTRRIIDLLPAFLGLLVKDSKKVFVVDEIDRSLHTLLIKQLIEAYLRNCSEKTRSQLLITTHNLLLMDQELLRRDEMWVTDRNSDGSTTMYSFSDYKDVRHDKDVRKSYLQGRLGGIPKIFLDPLPESCKEAK